MSKDEDLNTLYTSAKHLMLGGSISTVVMLIGGAWFFFRDIPGMGYTFGICSLMFMSMVAVGYSILRTVRRNMSKQ
jgi:hypothetical protein